MQSEEIPIVQNGAADKPPATQQKHDSSNVQSAFQNDACADFCSLFPVKHDQRTDEHYNRKQCKSICIEIRHRTDGNADRQMRTVFPVPFLLHSKKPAINQHRRGEDRRPVRIHIDEQVQKLRKHCQERHKINAEHPILKQPARNFQHIPVKSHAEKNIDAARCHQKCML